MRVSSRDLVCVHGDVFFPPSRPRCSGSCDPFNPGPSSLAPLRDIGCLGGSSLVVLGNHDLHLLVIYTGGHQTRRKDTLSDILDAPDHDRLVYWLRQQKLCVHDAARNLVMTHAGLPHVWSVSQAMDCAREVEAVIQGDAAEEYFTHMYGNQPERWDDRLQGMDRWRVITNYFTLSLIHL